MFTSGGGDADSTSFTAFAEITLAPPPLSSPQTQFGLPKRRARPMRRRGIDGGGLAGDDEEPGVAAVAGGRSAAQRRNVAKCQQRPDMKMQEMH